MAVLLEGCLPVLGILDGAILGIFHNRPKGLLPRPIWLNTAAAEKLDKSGLGFLGAGVFWLIASRDEGLRLYVIPKC